MPRATSAGSGERARRPEEPPIDHRVHITGASGAGTTTLGRALAERMRAPHLDTDDYFWLPTNPPFRTPRLREERLALLDADLPHAGAFVLSGSNRGWGDPLIPRYTLVVFLSVPTAIRLVRLRARERARYGAEIEPGGRMHAHFLEFIAWASRYDDGPETMRSRAAHEQWLAALPCPVLRLERTGAVAEHVEAIERFGARCA